MTNVLGVMDFVRVIRPDRRDFHYTEPLRRTLPVSDGDHKLAGGGGGERSDPPPTYPVDVRQVRNDIGVGGW